MWLTEYDHIIEALAWIEAIRRLARPFCKGDRGAVGLSQMLIALMPPKHLSTGSVAVANDLPRHLVATNRFSDFRDPFGRGMAVTPSQRMRHRS
jgi:hypothetical protein